MTLSGQEMVWRLLNDQYESYVFMDSIYSVHMNKYTFFSSFFLDISTSIGRARDIYAVSMYSMYQNMYRDQLSAGTQESLAVFVVAVYNWRLFFCHSSSPIFLLYLPVRCGRFLLLSIVRGFLGGFGSLISTSCRVLYVHIDSSLGTQLGLWRPLSMAYTVKLFSGFALVTVVR